MSEGEVEMLKEKKKKKKTIKQTNKHDSYPLLITNNFYEESKIKVQRMRWLNGWMASPTQWT